MEKVKNINLMYSKFSKKKNTNHTSKKLTENEIK